MDSSIFNLLKTGVESHKDVVGIDFGASNARAVRIAKNNGELVITQAWESAEQPTAAFSLPRTLRARAGALAISHPEAVAKLLSIPRPANKLDDIPFADLLGIANPENFRLAMEIMESTGSETTAIVAGMPETIISTVSRFFAQGFPAPQSLELAGLAALNGMLLGDAELKNQNLILLDLGADASIFAITLQDRVSFMRQFRIGANSIMQKLGESLGMDAETARDAVSDGVIDADEQVKFAFESLTRQLILGRDFVVRRTNMRPSKIIVSGGLFQAPFWVKPLQTALGVEAVIWNPLRALRSIPDALPAATVARGCRFAAAAGAALALLQERKK